MRGRLVVLYPALLLLVACGSISISRPIDVPEPTETNPARACTITCTNGGQIFFAAQHLCSHGNRQFEDRQIIGKIVDHWLACREYDYRARHCTVAQEFPPEAVVFKSCREVMRDIVDAREPDRRGRFPGEDEFGNSLSPPQR